MAKPRSRAADLAVYAAVRAAVCVLQAVPPAVAFWLADRLAGLVYRLAASRRRVALENLAAAYPELAADPAAAGRVVRAMYRHFVRAAVEGVLIPRKLHLTNWRAFVDLNPSPGAAGLMLDPRPVLLVTAHFGNWEVAGYALGVQGFRSHAVARVLDNPHLERFARRLRQASGQTIIAKKDDFDRLTAVLAAGGKVATLADQDAGPRGVFVPFFGRPASTHKAVALLALEFGAAVVVLGMPRVPRAGRPALPAPAGMEGTFFAVEVEDVIDPREYAGRPDAVAAITARYTAALERVIRRHPEQYFWLHRRWKHQPKAKPARAA
ncbi:MAG: lipid A biosynthesis acyltransferase [Isosphaera sp.]|nr:lipid A biosynthesis acyltransferase [Isosphaera sp.]